jgi:hypothetical protein
MDEMRKEERKHCMRVDYVAKAKMSIVWAEVFRMLDAEVRKCCGKVTRGAEESNGQRAKQRSWCPSRSIGIPGESGIDGRLLSSEKTGIVSWSWR